MNKRKILTINQYFSPVGGAEVIAYNTFKYLKENGYESFFWGTDKKPYIDENYEYIKYFTELREGTKAYLQNPLKYYYNYRAKKDLQKFIDKIKPDLIHIHGIPSLTYSILACCKNVPTVMTIHDSGLICPATTFMQGTTKYCTSDYCTKGHFFNCVKYKCDKGKLEPSIRHFILSNINLIHIKNVNHIITPSDALKRLLLRADIGIEEEDITTINTFTQTKNAEILTENKGYFLYLGRISREKGIQYLIDAMKNLPQEIQLHIVGKGPMYDELTQYTNNNGLNNIKFLGYISDEERTEEYKNCIATILPCNWFENCPATPIEGFIYGKPCIASNIGGIPEIVEHNKTGLLFEPANVEQLKDCILKYWNNNTLVLEHGQKAYTKAMNRYTEEKYYSDLLNIYENLLKMNRGKL